MNFKKLLSLFMAVLMTFSMLVPLTLSASAATGGVQDKLNEVMKEFPPVTKQGDPKTVYFTVSGKPSTSYSSDDCFYPDVARAHGYNWSNMWSAYSCCGFVHFVFRYIFGSEFTWTNDVNATTFTLDKTKDTQGRIADLDKFFKSCKVGDAIFFKRPSTHYAIFVSYDPQSQRVLTYDCSWDYECAVKTLNRSLSGMKDYESITRYHAKNYDKIDSQYAGTPTWTYNIISESEKTIEIAGYSGDVKTLTIPSQVDGYKVIGIADSAFENTSLESVKLPETLEYIGRNAFYSTPLYRNSLTENAVYISNCLIFINSDQEEYIVDRDTVLIADGAFDSSGIKIVALSDLIKNISDSVFNSSIEEIKGYKGTAAEAYANEHGLKFVALDSSADSPYSLKLGDINGDGKLSIADAKFVLQSIAGSKKLDKEQTKAADLNKDGKISIVDAKYILQVVAGTRTL